MHWQDFGNCAPQHVITPTYTCEVPSFSGQDQVFNYDPVTWPFKGETCDPAAPDCGGICRIRYAEQKMMRSFPVRHAAECTLGHAKQVAQIADQPAARTYT